MTFVARNSGKVVSKFQRSGLGVRPDHGRRRSRFDPDGGQHTPTPSAPQVDISSSGDHAGLRPYC